jgi:glycolate oxidase iron-sulfur subunit
MNAKLDTTTELPGPSRTTRGTPLPMDPRTYDRALSCVHCGLCLPACPTYTQTGHEADSPRGRIQLMRALADGVIEATQSVRTHLDLCLDCRACETACPSAVVYHELIEETRALMAPAEARRLTTQGRFMRWVFFNVFVHPTRLKLALLPARVMQKLGVYPALRRWGMFDWLPAQLRKMELMLPEEGAIWPRALPARIAPRAPLRGTAKRVRVGFFPGCIGSVMFEKVNRQAVELLAAGGATVIVPQAQNCCGAIHHHNGAWRQAAEFARRNVDAFLPEDGPPVDFIATNIAGCGAMLKDYDHLLRDDPKYAGRAKAFAKKVRDISEVLLEVGVPEMRHPVSATVTYHDACHLAHAQKVTVAPRKLLAKVPGLKLVPLAESDMCCGAAGTYNLTQPDMSSQLAERKLKHIASTGAQVCVTGNVGCAMQIQSEAAARGQKLAVVHPVELLHRAVFGDHR